LKKTKYLVRMSESHPGKEDGQEITLQDAVWGDGDPIVAGQNMTRSRRATECLTGVRSASWPGYLSCQASLGQ
jgi:hypothetical protein